MQYIARPQKQLRPKLHCPCAPCTSTLTPAGPLLKVLALLQQISSTWAPATIAMQDWTIFTRQELQANAMQSPEKQACAMNYHTCPTASNFSLLPEGPCHDTVNGSVPVSCFMPAWPVRTRDQAKGGVSRYGSYHFVVLIHALPRYR